MRETFVRGTLTCMRMRCFAITLVILFAVAAGAQRPPVRQEEPNHTKMRAYNAGLTAIFQVLSAKLQGEPWNEVWRHLLIGAGGGAAFYEAKRLTGDGNVTAGWLISNATRSVLENTASGEHWLGRLGYTIGPARLNFATKYAEKGAAKIDVDVSLAEVFLLAYALNQSDHVSFRNGMITTDRDTAWEDGDRAPLGRTIGVFPGVVPNLPRTFWQHEVVHVIQVQQMESVDTPLWTIAEDRDPGDRPLFALRHLKAGYPLIMNYVNYRRPYQEQWVEVEAWWLAEGTPVRP